MRYLKLELRAIDQRVLYEKDVDVPSAFELFIRTLVSDLVGDGTLCRGEHYSALVIPRYGDRFRESPILVVSHEQAGEQADWIEMRPEGPLQPDSPIDHVTVELRVQERSLVYRRDYRVPEVARHYVCYGVTQALLGLGVLKNGEQYYTLLYARDDDQAQFDREHIPALQRQAASLVELMPDESPAVAFPFRDPSMYGKAEVVGQVGPEDIRIFAARATVDRWMAEARLPADVERGGLLVGRVYQATDGGRHLVEVSDLIVSQYTASSMVELRYTFESWRSNRAMLKKEFPGKRIVGWYHSHLVDVTLVSKENRVELTKMFFSREDVFLHKQFFLDPWYVAMVLDAQGNNLFFQWKNDDVAPCGGYHIFEEPGVAERV